MAVDLLVDPDSVTKQVITAGARQTGRSLEDVARKALCGGIGQQHQPMSDGDFSIMRPIVRLDLGTA